MSVKNWEKIYSKGSQLNEFPFTEVVTFLNRNLPRSLHGATGLDIGCGSGVHSALMAKYGLNVTGFDPSESAVLFARKKWSDDKIIFKIDSIEKFQSQSKFDIVIDRLSTSHTNKLRVKSFYKKLPKYLKDHGKIFWQGFSACHSDMRYGKYDYKNDSWSDFKHGMFRGLGTVAFFDESEVDEIFKDYRILNKFKKITEDKISKMRNSIWQLELTVGEK
jgi:cyclopropane fatty-acyl-phospholipid synthase-like methyltransferase